MRKAMRVLGGTVVASLVVVAVSVYAETPTKSDFVACNAEAQAAMRAGTATPTAKDSIRVEAARKERATTSTKGDGPIDMEFSDPQLVGMATDGITDAGYQATYRTCMRRNGF